MKYSGGRHFAVLVIDVLVSRCAGLINVRAAPSGGDTSGDGEEVASTRAIVARYGKGGASFAGQQDGEAHSSPKAQGVPVINFDMNINHHFEVLVSLIHWFKGGDLPYHSGLPKHTRAILSAARHNGSEVFVNPQYLRAAERHEILFDRLKDYDIQYGYHTDPDLTVIVTVYANLEVFKVAAQHHWRNDEKLLLVVHDFEQRSSSESFSHFVDDVKLDLNGTPAEEFVNFSTWENALGLMPQLPRYVIPSFFPYHHQRHCGTARNRSSEDWVPTFCVHGTFNRRDWVALAHILSATPASCPYDVKIAGLGPPPKELKPYRARVQELRLNDIRFLDFFCECDYLLPLMTTRSSPAYFRTKLSSTAARSIGHNLPVIASKEFHEAYPMVEGSFYVNEYHFRELFRRVTGC